MKVAENRLEGCALWELAVVGNEPPLLYGKADVENADTISELYQERSSRGLALGDRPAIKGHTAKHQ